MGRRDFLLLVMADITDNFGVAESYATDNSCNLTKENINRFTSLAIPIGRTFIWLARSLDVNNISVFFFLCLCDFPNFCHITTKQISHSISVSR